MLRPGGRLGTVGVMTAPQPRRSRHLMDLDNPPPVRATRAGKEGMGLEGVQKWVMSALAVTTILHLAFGLMIFALSFDDEHRASQIGLNIIAGVFGVLGIASGFMIHRRSPLTPWLALGLLPGALGIWLCLR